MTEQQPHKGAGHRQRLRDRFLELGIDGFTDAEVLELLLTFGTPRTDCKTAARSALARFGTLPEVLDAPIDELRRIKGIGPKNAMALCFIQGVARRYLQRQLKERHYLTSSRQVADYLRHAMRGLKREVFMAIFLDGGHAVIGTPEIVAEGTINLNTVYPRELVKRALDHNAAALVVAHNHPSGRLNPSAQDISLTRTLFLACSFMNIRLLDHLVVGDGETVYSFADHGLMTEIDRDNERLVGKLTGGG